MQQRRLPGRGAGSPSSSPLLRACPAAAAVKRLIGRDYDDVAQDARQLAYSMAADEDGFAVLECPNLEGGAGALCCSWGLALSLR